MWQPNIPSDFFAQQIGSSVLLASEALLHPHLRRAMEPAGGVAPSSYAVALRRYVRTARQHVR